MFVCISCSPKILNTDEGIDMILEIVRRYPRDTIFATNYMRISSLIVENGYKCIPFFTLATFRNKLDGMMEMSRRMMKMATHFHTIVEEGGAVRTAVMMAMEYQRQHPGYFMEIMFKSSTGVKTLTFDEIKRIAKWKL